MKLPPYTAYGARAPHLTGICLGFNGENYDPIPGGYALGLGYRMYSPSLMRFLSPDTLSPFGKGGHHTYAYCKNDPVNHVDRTGHMRTPPPYARRLEPQTMQRRSPPSWPSSSRSASNSRSGSANSVDLADLLSGYTGKEIDFPLDFLHNSPAPGSAWRPGNPLAFDNTNPSSALSWPDFFRARGMAEPSKIFEESKRLAASITLDYPVADPVSFRTRVVIYMATAGNARDPRSVLRSVYRNITDMEVGETTIYADYIRKYTGTTT
ncbi:RHS repeat-associated core domain-containing protein [Pseudomonas putida]|uniref:RHS repeat-associated core domain-containing protein n=1 Tax=Pseudomonas putida TaxID=303 RepID=UPI0024E0BEAE|nr:RHS repeat-associated core domain-containing protein [Pseudomonas putida]HDS0967922.1 RHS repeat-associated core domain-containing protein [Pseudomonas putida]